MLGADRFFYGVGMVTTRGIATVDSPNDLVPVARALRDDPRIGWISLTDNPGGVPMLPPDWFVGLVPEQLARVVLHLTCKDMNRNALEASGWHYASVGCHNVLALTGDYPITGVGGSAGAVFDIDSVGLIALLTAMNEGLRVSTRTGKTEALQPTDFFIGCCVSPFKRHQRELMPQYLKLLLKIRAGARWIIPQLGYDMRKFHEVKLLLESRGLDLPAKQVAVFRGLNFAGVCLGGVASAESAGRIIDMAEGFGENDWREFAREIQFAQPGEFFFKAHHVRLSRLRRLRALRLWISLPRLRLREGPAQRSVRGNA